MTKVEKTNMITLGSLWAIASQAAPALNFSKFANRPLLLFIKMALNPRVQASWASCPDLINRIDADVEFPAIATPEQQTLLVKGFHSVMTPPGQRGLSRKDILGPAML